MANVSLNQDKLVRVTAGSARAVTPSDSVDLPERAEAGLYVIVTGNVAFLDGTGNAVTLASVPVFTRIPIVASRVKLTGTSATVLALN